MSESREKLLGQLNKTLSDVHSLSYEEFGYTLSEKAQHQFMQVLLLKQVMKACVAAVAIGTIQRKRVEETAKQDESAYCQFVEDFLNFAFIKRHSAPSFDGSEGESTYINLMALLSLPTLMHGAFISTNLQAKVVAKVEANISGLMVRNNIEDKEQAAILARIRTILTEDKEKPAQKKKSAAGGKRISVVGRKRVQASPKKEEPEKPLEEDSVPQIDTNVVRKPAPPIEKLNEGDEEMLFGN